MGALHPVGDARGDALHQLAGGRIAVEVSIERANEGEVCEARPRAQQEGVRAEVAGEVIQEGLVRDLDAGDGALMHAEHGQGALEALAVLLADFVLFRAAQLRRRERAELGIGPVFIIGPAIVHGGDDQPFVGIELQQLGDEALHRRGGLDRGLAMLGGLDMGDDLGGVLHDLAVRHLHDRDHGPADFGQDDVAIDGLRGDLLVKLHPPPAQVSPRLAGEIADLGAVERVACHSEFPSLLTIVVPHFAPWPQARTEG